VLTRRSFLGAVAALVVLPRVAPVAAERFRFVQTCANMDVFDVGRVEVFDYARFHFTETPRRDDGDTILELR
jgi:hypothetical protein